MTRITLSMSTVRAKRTEIEMGGWSPGELSQHTHTLSSYSLQHKQYLLNSLTASPAHSHQTRSNHVSSLRVYIRRRHSSYSIVVFWLLELVRSELRSYTHIYMCICVYKMLVVQKKRESRQDPQTHTSTADPKLLEAYLKYEQKAKSPPNAAHLLTCCRW